VSLAETITAEDEFRAKWPRHAEAVFDYLKRDPALKAHPWTFARAVVRRPYLATVLLESISGSGERTQLWLSAASDGDSGWSIQPVLKGAARE
jgi:hypothetical protein